MAMRKAKPSSDPTSDLCPYDVAFFIEKHGLSRDAAEVILHTYGPSRQRCDHAAKGYMRFNRLKEALRKPPASITKT